MTACATQILHSKNCFLILKPPDSRRPSAMPSETSEMIPLMTRADQWEFPRDRLRLSTVLGTGAFGMVMRGDAQGIRGSIGRVKCAVKMVKGKIFLFPSCTFLC